MQIFWFPYHYRGSCSIMHAAKLLGNSFILPSLVLQISTKGAWSFYVLYKYLREDGVSHSLWPTHHYSQPWGNAEHSSLWSSAWFSPQTRVVPSVSVLISFWFVLIISCYGSKSLPGYARRQKSDNPTFLWQSPWVIFLRPRLEGYGILSFTPSSPSPRPSEWITSSDGHMVISPREARRQLLSICNFLSVSYTCVFIQE